MKSAFDKMTRWVQDKIETILAKEHGFKINDSKSYDTIEVVDSMGFIYQITIRRVGRNITEENI